MVFQSIPNTGLCKVINIHFRFGSALGEPGLSNNLICFSLSLHFFYPEGGTREGLLGSSRPLRVLGMDGAQEEKAAAC